MSDFAATWELIRGRFDKDVSGRSIAQLNFRLHPDTLTIGEMALHVAGVELWFISQLEQRDLSGTEIRLARAAREGVITADPFPFAESEIEPALVAEALGLARAAVERHIYQPSPEILAREIQSALGPVIDGRGAFARLAYHPGYHQGQVHMITVAPGFPA